MRSWKWAAAALVVLAVVLGAGGAVRADEPVLDHTVFLPHVVQGEPVPRVLVEAWGNPPDGATWTAIAARTPLDGWLGDSLGHLYRLTYAAYSPVPSPASAEVTAISIAPDASAWATTASGQVLQWDGAAWREIVVFGGRMESVSAVSSSLVWAVGEPGAYVWNGATWTATTWPNTLGDDFATSPARVVAVSPSLAWLATRASPSPSCLTRLYQWDGTAWRGQERMTRVLLCITDMAALENDAVALAGTRESFRDGVVSGLQIWDGAAWEGWRGGQSGLTYLAAVEGELCVMANNTADTLVECGIGRYLHLPTRAEVHDFDLFSLCNGWVIIDQLYRVNFCRS